MTRPFTGLFLAVLVALPALAGCTTPPPPATPVTPGALALGAADYAVLADAAAAGDKMRALDLYEKAIALETNPEARLELHARAAALHQGAEPAPVQTAGTPRTTGSTASTTTTKPDLVVVVGSDPAAQPASVDAVEAGAAPVESGLAHSTDPEVTPSERRAADMRMLGEGRVAEAISMRLDAAGGSKEPALRSEHLQRASEMYSSHSDSLNEADRSTFLKALLTGFEQADSEDIPGLVRPRVHLLLGQDLYSEAEAFARKALSSPVKDTSAEGRAALLEIWTTIGSLAERVGGWEHDLAAGKLSAEDAGFLVLAYQGLATEPVHMGQACRVRLGWFPSDRTALDCLAASLSGAGDARECVAAGLDALARVADPEDRDFAASIVVQTWASLGADALDTEFRNLMQRVQEDPSDLDALVLMEAALSGPLHEPRRAEQIRESRVEVENALRESMEGTARQYAVLLGGHLSSKEFDKAHMLCEEIRTGRFPWKLRVQAVRALAEIQAAGARED